MGKKFSLSIECENDVIIDSLEIAQSEILSILEVVTKNIENGNIDGVIRNFDGKKIGTYELADE